ncbi:Zinc finger protein [Plecturocebus cupreus]
MIHPPRPPKVLGLQVLTPSGYPVTSRQQGTHLALPTQQIIRDEDFASFLNHGLWLQFFLRELAFARVKHFLARDAGKGKICWVWFITHWDLDGVRINGTRSKHEATGSDSSKTVKPCSSVFWKGLQQGLSLSLRPECSGVIIVHCKLELLGSNNASTSASQSAGITNMSHLSGNISNTDNVEIKE